MLFVLFAIRTKGKAGPVPSMTLLGMINRGRSAEVFPSNFRTSCHTLVDNGLLGKYRDEQVTAPRPKGEASHFLGRYRRYDGFTLASMGRNDESRRL